MTGGGGRRGGCRRWEAAGDRALNATRQSQTRRSGRRCPSGKRGNLFHSLWTVRWSFPHVWTRFIHTCGKLRSSGVAKGSRQASLRWTASPRWIVCLDGPPSLGEDERAFVGAVRRSGVESAMAALASAFAKRLLRGSCGAEFVSEAQGRIVFAVRRAARSARFGVERKGISRPGDVSVCTASPPERRGGPQGE
mgnify:CR=1 FL=1